MDLQRRGNQGQTRHRKAEALIGKTHGRLHELPQPRLGKVMQLLLYLKCTVTWNLSSITA